MTGLVFQFTHMSRSNPRPPIFIPAEKVRAREHIVQGMLQALGMIDDVIALVRAR